MPNYISYKPFVKRAKILITFIGDLGIEKIMFCSFTFEKIWKIFLMKSLFNFYIKKRLTEIKNDGVLL